MKKVILGAIVAGAAIGALNVAHYFTTKQISGVETPFGLFPGGFPVATFLGLSGKGLSPGLVAMLVLGVGILAGSIISARLSGDLTISKFKAKKLSVSKLSRAGLGGVLMGAGTWMAQGCLIKHTLSGAPGLMLSSFTTLAGIVAGIWLSARVEERWA
ncbi:MAG: YeeE/YedE thiosulfate transporter family protein [Planctomycetota bacterium]|jgi:uncharacterized membrane protein YedE/YeeE